MKAVIVGHTSHGIARAIASLNTGIAIVSPEEVKAATDPELVTMTISNPWNFPESYRPPLTRKERRKLERGKAKRKSL